VGYTGGTRVDPSYHHLGDHTEALQIDYDPTVIDFGQLATLFWSAHEPTRPAFSRQYRAAAWWHDEEQRALLLQGGEAAANARGGALETAIEPLTHFYRAEDYHQKYRLRREHELMAELMGHYPDDEAMVDSTRAARLNGFLRGYGRRHELKALLSTLALSPRAEKLLLARVNG
jgi:peptide-methionine (S)-S-oxide reductase